MIELQWGNDRQVSVGRDGGGTIFIVLLFNNYYISWFTEQPSMRELLWFMRSETCGLVVI